MFLLKVMANFTCAAEIGSILIILRDYRAYSRMLGVLSTTQGPGENIIIAGHFPSHLIQDFIVAIYFPSCLIQHFIDTGYFTSHLIQHLIVAGYFTSRII